MHKVFLLSLLPIVPLLPLFLPLLLLPDSYYVLETLTLYRLLGQNMYPKQYITALFRSSEQFYYISIANGCVSTVMYIKLGMKRKPSMHLHSYLYVGM